MRTITFYSYKGGTGRTLLLANMAVLAARLGRKVVVVDLDLEAPGLDYKLIGAPPQNTPGAVHWLQCRVATREVTAIEPLLIDVPVEDPFTSGGWLRLLPAGGGPSLEYFAALQELSLDQHIASGEAADAFLDLQDAICEQIRPDLLLLDARTGVATSNLATTRVLADDVVALTLNTPEQLEGTRAVLRSLAPLTSLRTGDPLGLHVVLSRVAPRPAEVGSYAMTDAERQQAAAVRAMLEAPADPVSDTLVVDRVHLLHTELSLVTGDFLLLRRGDAIDATALHIDYIRVAEALLGSDVTDAATAAIARETDAQARERTARFFGRVDAVTEARGARSEGASPTEERDTDDLVERVGLLRARAETDPTVVPDLAALLVRATDLYRELGQREAELAAAEEATVLYRRLRDAHTEDGSPNLAGSLNRLATVRADLGFADEALAASLEAADSLRRLAEVDEQRHLADLAWTLTSLGTYFDRVGRDQEAHAAIEEAVALYRRLSDDPPAQYLGELARALYNLGLAASALGHEPEALAATEEAVALYRMVVKSDSERYEGRFASALDSLSIKLAHARRDDEALAACEEAVAIRRRIATSSPERAPAEFAGLLYNYSLLLSGLGRGEEALTAAEEAVEHFRRLYAADSARYLARLGSALSSMSSDLLSLGRNEESVAAIDEAVAVLREAGSDASRAQQLALASALGRRGFILDGIGDSAPELSMAKIESLEEAVNIYGRFELAEWSTEKVGFATALSNLGLAYLAVDRHEDALAATEQALEQRKSLAARDPDSYTADLVGTLINRGIVLVGLKRVEDAVAAIEEAITTMERRPTYGDSGIGERLQFASGMLASLYDFLGRADEAQAARDWRERLLADMVAGEDAAGHRAPPT